MIVAIDGPAGSGKSTVARAVAAREGLTYLDTGAMYRSVTDAALARGVDVSDAEALTALASSLRIEFVRPEGEGEPRVLVDGADRTGAIRTPEVDRNVSAVSAVPGVREAMVARQRELSREGDVVAEGRDIGTVVFPAAEVKVFLTADDTARARRRTHQRGEDTGDGAAEREAQVLEDLRRRDKLDSSRKTAPLKAADDAVRIDSTELTVEEVCGRIHELIEVARHNSQPQVKGEGSAKKPHVEEKTSAEDRPARPAKARRKASALEPMHAFTSPAEAYYEHGMDEFPPPAKLLFRLVVFLARIYTGIFWPMRWEGEQRFVEHVREHGSVIVMNHVSFIEPVKLGIMLWSHGLHFRPIYKSEFNKVRISQWFFSRMGCIPVVRGSADLKAVKNAKAALQRGECVLIFPEGTRILSDDQPVTVHGGFALMAQLGRADIVPMAVTGARKTWEGGAKAPLRRAVTGVIGDPISFASLGVSGRKAQVAAMEDAAWKRVVELRGQLRRRYPGTR